jgi:two-component system, cell cycle sensor histidine kinase and response regulator CckA
MSIRKRDCFGLRMDVQRTEVGEDPKNTMGKPMRLLQKLSGKGWNATVVLAIFALVVFSCSFAWMVSAAEACGRTPPWQLLLSMILFSLFVLGAVAAAWRVSARNLALRISLDQEERSRREVEEKNRQLSREITERKRAEAAVRESEERYRRFFDGDLSGSFIVTPEGRILACNPAFANIFGFSSVEEALKADFLSLRLDPQDQEHFLALLQERKALKHYLTEYRRVDGQIITTIENAIGAFDENGNLVEIRGFVVDNTEQKKLEDQLRHSQKMEAIGTLAGGIAHDFNNILTAVLGNAEMGLIRVSEENDVRRNFAEILKATKRAKDLVRQILTFSRQERPEPKPLQIGAVIEEVLRLLRATLPSTIEIHSNIEPNAGIVLADPIQIHQLLMNLCTNAAYAMQKDGGGMEVSLGHVDVGNNKDLNELGLKPGRYVELMVRDTGCGMDQDLVKRIFDPFFTTKPLGEGSGMGLAVVHGIVRSLDGGLRVETELGTGSTFRVFLPKIADNLLQEADAVEPVAEDNNHGRILLVDDEESLLSIGKQMLEHLGYRVTDKSSGIEALSCFRGHPEAFDLVISDQTMPKMTGSDLAAALLSIRPDIPIILCSGYADTLDEDRMKNIGVQELVLKPFVFSELAEIARKVLKQKVRRPT